MADRLKRGSAPGRARSEDQRPGSFKKGHKKRGGRQRGTPNKFSAEHKKDILEAAHRVGEDANGTLGVVGYLRWVARRYPRIFCGMLGSVLELQELEIGLPQKERPTVEEFDQVGKGAYWARRPRPNYRRNPRSPSAADCTRRKDPRRQTEPARAPQKANEPTVSDLPWAWTGRDAPVGQLIARCFRPRCRGQQHCSAGLPRDAPGRNAGARRNAGAQNSTQGSRVEETTDCQDK